jgi:hypothetical protein
MDDEIVHLRARRYLGRFGCTIFFLGGNVLLALWDAHIRAAFSWATRKSVEGLQILVWFPTRWNFVQVQFWHFSVYHNPWNSVRWDVGWLPYVRNSFVPGSRVDFSDWTLLTAKPTKIDQVTAVYYSPLLLQGLHFVIFDRKSKIKM